MTMVQELARFAARSRWEDVSRASQEALKKRVLDALGCAYGALEAPPIRAIREHTIDFGGNPLSTLIGGGRTSPDRAAFQNGAAVRYLDFNDTFLGRGEACHPSDNLAPVLAAADYIGASGKEMLAGLAVAYQVQLRLSQAPRSGPRASTIQLRALTPPRPGSLGRLDWTRIKPPTR